MPNYKKPYEHYFHRGDGSSVIAYRSKTYGYWEVVIDTEDFVKVINRFWQLIKDKRTSYAATYIRKNDKRSSISMHRFVLNDIKGIIDHKDGHGLNNRKGNLRVVEAYQNRANSKIPTTNKSGFKGVCYCKTNKTYVVWITYKYKRHYCGSYQNVLLAAKRYNEVALELLGEYAKLNVFTPQEESEISSLSTKVIKRIKQNKHGYIGVGVDNDRKNKYKASIWVNKQLIRIGNYATIEEAAIAYNAEAIKNFGEFARLNKVV